MTKTNKYALLAAAVVVLIGGYFLFADRPAPTTVAVPEACSLQKSSCSGALPGGGKVSLSIAPRPIAYDAQLTVEVTIEGAAAEKVEIDFNGAVVNTSYNRVPLQATEPGRFKGVAVLPVCMSGGMDWQATVLVESGGNRVPVPFLFNSDPAAPAKAAPRPELAATPRGGDFLLRTAEGPLSLAKLRGKAVVMFFAQSEPPVGCPNSLSVVDKAFALLTPDEMALVKGLMISADPERDTVERLKTFLGAGHPNIIGASGGGADLAGAAQQFGAHFTRQAADKDGRYRVDHSAIIYLVAPSGSFVEQLTSQDPNLLATKLRVILARK